MREAGGRAVERNLSLPVKTGDEAIGVKPEFNGEVPENSLAKFHVISLDRDGQKQAGDRPDLEARADRAQLPMVSRRLRLALMSL